MIKERFDNFLSEGVDGKGKPVRTGCGYSENTRIQYLINTEVGAKTEKLSRDITKMVDASVDRYVRDKIAKILSQQVINNIDLDGLISQAKTGPA
jgi:hypothetical protein